MIRLRPISIVVPLLLAFLLAGCIAVDDFGHYWDKGFTDACVNDIVLREMEEDNEGAKAAGAEMRSLRLGNHTFLMMRERKHDKGGNLMLYKLMGDDFVTYRLNENKRDEFLRDYPATKIILTSETATIPVLDEQTADMLAQLASDPSYWRENERHPYNPTARTDCIRELAK